MTRRQTPSQTIGPFFAYGLTPEQYGYPFASVATPVVAKQGAAGERIAIEGRVLDGDGAPVLDALVEIWQADGEGRFASGRGGAFLGFGRCGTGVDPEQRFRFETVKPGPIAPGEAPHVAVALFLRGLLTHVYTRIYFSDEAAANASDPVLGSVPPERRDTLVARRDASGGAVVYRFDIRLQGERETVFFDA